MPRNQSRIAFATTATIVFGLLAANSAFAADTYKVLHWFDGKVGYWKNGGQPTASPIFDASGNLYGTTRYGGAGNGGTLFQLAPGDNGHWTEHVLYNFCSATDCTDGNQPYGSLIFDSAGSLYGTTTYGGSARSGVVFQLKPGPNSTWTENVLYSFCAMPKCADGGDPFAALVFDSSGNLYGTTWTGGAQGGGTVFQLVPDANGTWTENVLYSFCALSECGDGGFPLGSLILDSSGNLYGTTTAGGTHNGGFCPGDGCGAIFALTREKNGSWTERVIHSFNYNDGEEPTAALVSDRQGKLFGTTYLGGAHDGGVVFQLTQNAGGAWTETVIHQFDIYHIPSSTLVFDNTGNLYGTTRSGGIHGEGTVFKLSPGQNSRWAQMVLHSFDAKSGSLPLAGIILDSAGDLYGAANGGGIDDGGVVFEITP